MRDTLSLSSSPVDEECAQVGSPDYHERARRECRAYIHQLDRQFPDRPKGVYFRTMWSPHDFGNYAEVHVVYDDGVKEQVDYAFNCEDNMPTEWDQEAREELSEA